MRWINNPQQTDIISYQTETKDETKIVRKNISITLKQQMMIDEMSKNNYEINLSSIARREIEKIYNEFKLKK